MPKKTDELAARQEAALAKNTARKEQIEALKNQNSFLTNRITELEAAGNIPKEEADALRAELDKSNTLLEELQDAILAEDETETTPPTDPA
jgi:hypothetical protein